MRFVAMVPVGAFVAALALASPAAALSTLELVNIGGGQYLIQLTVGPEGLAVIQWGVVSESGIPDVNSSTAVGFSVPSSDPACETVIGGCNFSASGPSMGTIVPHGLANFDVFITNPAQALQGAPMDQPFTVGFISFTNPGSEGLVSFGPQAASCVVGSGEAGTIATPSSCGTIPEPATSSLLGLALLGLGVVARGRSSRAD